MSNPPSFTSSSDSSSGSSFGSEDRSGSPGRGSITQNHQNRTPMWIFSGGPGNVSCLKNAPIQNSQGGAQFPGQGLLVRGTTRTLGGIQSEPLSSHAPGPSTTPTGTPSPMSGISNDPERRPVAPSLSFLGLASNSGGTNQQRSPPFAVCDASRTPQKTHNPFSIPGPSKLLGALAQPTPPTSLAIPGQHTPPVHGNMPSTALNTSNASTSPATEAQSPFPKVQAGDAANQCFSFQSSSSNQNSSTFGVFLFGANSPRPQVQGRSTVDNHFLSNQSSSNQSSSVFMDATPHTPKSTFKQPPQTKIKNRLLSPFLYSTDCLIGLLETTGANANRNSTSLILPPSKKIFTNKAPVLVPTLVSSFTPFKSPSAATIAPPAMSIENMPVAPTPTSFFTPPPELRFTSATFSSTPLPKSVPPSTVSPFVSVAPKPQTLTIPRAPDIATPMETLTTIIRSNGPEYMPIPTATAAILHEEADPSPQVLGNPQEPRLEVRSLERIIDMWACDLEQNQRQFQEQAREIKKWDSVLVDGHNIILGLTTGTYEAEMTHKIIENALEQLQREQFDMEKLFDFYEAVINHMEKESLEIQPTDVEREYLFNTILMLSSNLLEMQSGAGKLIASLNSVREKVECTRNTNISSILTVLNQHLQVMQWIDTQTAGLATRITNARRLMTSRTDTDGDEIMRNINMQYRGRY